MNANCFAASLTNGYGHPVAHDMIEALGLDLLEDDHAAAMPRPIVVNGGARLCRVYGRAANSNLQLPSQTFGSRP